MENGKVSYRMMGEGDLPVDAIMRALRSINYEGYVSLEWVKQLYARPARRGHRVPALRQFHGPVPGRERTAASRLHDNNCAKPASTSGPRSTLIDLTFPQVLDRMVEEFPDQYAFRYTTLDYTRTYAEFRDDVDTFARGPHRHGREARATTWPSGPPTCPSGTSPSGPPPRSARCW